LRVRIALVGGLAIPVQSLVVILSNTAAMGVHVTKVEFALGVAMLRGFAIPIHCLGVVNGLALAVIGQVAEAVIGVNVALVGGLAIPEVGQVEIAWDVNGEAVAVSKQVLGGGIARIGSLLESGNGELGVCGWLCGRGERAEAEGKD
jgi:hypothetical protein